MEIAVRRERDLAFLRAKLKAEAHPFPWISEDGIQGKGRSYFWLIFGMFRGFLT